MTWSYCRVRVTAYVALVVSSLLIGVSTCGCNRQDVDVGSPVTVQGLPVVDRHLDASSDPVPLFGPISTDVSAGALLLVTRIALRRGAVSVVVRDRAGSERARRSIARIGPNLVLIPLTTDGRVSVEVVQIPDSGSLGVDIESMLLVPVMAGDAGARAAELAGAFERETGRLADPFRENLVDNADFAEDDEVRGTPRNWFAYVPTSSEALTHSMHVAGTPPSARPAVATGPVPVSSSNRYRLFVRMRVASGPVILRVTDYDELVTLAESHIAVGRDKEQDVTFEFTPPPGCHGVRVEFGTETPGTPVDFDLALIQMEELP